MGILVCLQSLSSRPNHSTIDSERRTLYPRGLVIDRKAGSISVIESPPLPLFVPNVSPSLQCFMSIIPSIWMSMPPIKT
nr:hypothetical protein Q903MT_gene3482 [Picea sitchensis]